MLWIEFGFRRIYVAARPPKSMKSAPVFTISAFRIYLRMTPLSSRLYVQ